ncbi:tetratricopeptide repeat protein [Jeongeupia sp. USM3]|uniref:tetratricopeptide repeat protein n=1 Tax=Jeongeupia sp. USM3 TaxID=1906741 RepID=UPI00089DEB0B|nr:tetratricopeptide repeat protein [Jeongeupia sp. USM3]AOY01197.1 hypothetical protein BJP62_12540 [Jeongeupia sp. USM3]
MHLLLMLCLALAGAADPAWTAHHRGDGRDAARQYQAGAGTGDVAAQAMLQLNGEGLAGDDTAVLHWLRFAAESGSPPAQCMLGRLYEQGHGVPRSQTEATRWFELAARQGHTGAQVDLATQYFLGRGAPQDMRRAARWYERAAEGGDIGAQYIVATLYERGDGVPRDLAQAWHWYRAAALQGDPAAAIRARDVGQRIVNRAQH